MLYHKPDIELFSLFQIQSQTSLQLNLNLKIPHYKFLLIIINHTFSLGSAWHLYPILAMYNDLLYIPQDHFELLEFCVKTIFSKHALV